MLKKFISICLVLIMLFCITACGNSSSGLPKYESKQFELSGLWAPIELNEESLNLYKEAGFTTFLMSNHWAGDTSEKQFYLGSKRTMMALELCKKAGLNAVLSHSDWIAGIVEGEEYYSETPFSKYDLYGDYKDIITGVGICDEPHIDQMDLFANKTMVEDFKKVYPNADYRANLIPITAVESRGFESYDQMMQIFEEKFMEPFENPYISVDVYPFHHDMKEDERSLLANYRYIADSAKKYNVKPAFILQASLGNEFEDSLSESDLRWEVYNAMAFGADTLQYYCYSVPKRIDENGEWYYLYDGCILNRDDTPSEIYYSLQKIHKEIQSFASVILSYDWQQTIGVSGSEDTTYRVSGVEFDSNLEYIKLENTENFVEAKGENDLAISRFTSEEYGEAYMFVNWADRNDSNIVNATFKNCEKLAIYGGIGFEGTPEIVELDENGNITFELAYGEGVFITPIVK